MFIASVACLLLASLCLSQEPVTELLSGHPLEIDLLSEERAFESDFPNRSFSYRADRAGTVYVYAEADAIGTVLILSPKRETQRVFSRGKQPVLKARIEAGETIEVLLVGTPAGAAGTCRLITNLAPSSPESRSAASTARRALDDLWITASERGENEALRRLQSELGVLRASEGYTTSREANDVVWEIAMEAVSRRLSRVAILATTEALEFSERFLPEGHADRQVGQATLAISHHRLGATERADEMFRSLFERAYTDPIAVMTARLYLSDASRRTGDLGLAKKHADLGMRAGEGLVPESDALLNQLRGTLGLALIEEQRWDEALEIFRKVTVVTSEALPARAADYVATLKGEIACLAGLGFHEEELAARRRLIQVYGEELPSLASDLFSARLDTAQRLKTLGRFSRARELEEEAISELEDHVPSHGLIWYGRANLAQTLKDLGEWEVAKELEEAVLAHWLEHGAIQEDDVLRAKGNLAYSLSRTGDPERAAALLRECVTSWANRVGKEDLYKRALHNLGDLLLNRGEAEEAREVLLEAFGHDPLEELQVDMGVIGLYMSYANALKRSGQLDRAHRLEEKMLAAAAERLPEHHPYWANLLNNRTWTLIASIDTERLPGHLRRLRRYVTRRLLHIATRSSPRELEHQSGALHASVSAILTARMLYPDLCRQALSDSDLLVLVETVRSPGLRLSHRLRAIPSSSRVDELRAAVLAASREITELSRKPMTLEQRIGFFSTVQEQRRAQRELWIASREALGDSGETSLATDDKLARVSLKESELAVAFWSYDHFSPSRNDSGLSWSQSHRLIAFVVHPDSVVELVPICDYDEIDSRMADWISEIQLGMRPAEERRAGTALRNSLLVPLEEFLEGVERVAIVPSGALHSLPFDALPDESTAVLGDEMQVLTFPFLSAVHFDSKQAMTVSSALLVGGVEYQQSGNWPDLEPLTHSLTEVAGINRIMQGASDAADVLELVGTKATSASVSSSAVGRDCIHIAAHAVSDTNPIRAGDPTRHFSFSANTRPDRIVSSSNPLAMCGLVLSPDATSEGRLTYLSGEELAALDLSYCKLAVLSACNTARGKREGPLGTASLQKALHMAGAELAVTSAWRVPDESTRALMEHFYHYALKEDLSPSVALWEAKKRMRDVRADTREWAAWILSDAGPKAWLLGR